MMAIIRYIFECVFHAIALTFDHNGFRMMEQTIQQSGGHSGIIVEDRSIWTWICGKAGNLYLCSSFGRAEKRVTAKREDVKRPFLIEFYDGGLGTRKK